MKPLLIGRSARTDLANIKHHTENNWSDLQRDAYMALLQEKFAMVQRFPASGARRDFLLPGLRSIPAGAHIIYYRETEADIRIL
ncbi:type II toxin-antitoxin system RelE/ParE family toxin, partial [Ferrovibrio sp.]|uniref:type II toxin-antitoxin system RelE/ParE family toxin n=1 Tax=Ferrovibrio sp. TaxID=1917215 RepID=UPI0025BA06FB